MHVKRKRNSFPLIIFIVLSRNSVLLRLCVCAFFVLFCTGFLSLSHWMLTAQSVLPNNKLYDPTNSIRKKRQKKLQRVKEAEVEYDKSVERKKSGWFISWAQQNWYYWVCWCYSKCINRFAIWHSKSIEFSSFGWESNKFSLLLDVWCATTRTLDQQIPLNNTKHRHFALTNSPIDSQHIF